MPPSQKIRKVKVSSQMQVRIPADLYAKFGFGSEAICVETETGVEFRPAKSAAEQDADILKELLDSGLEGEKLLEAFRAKTRENADSYSYYLASLPE